MLVRTRYIYFGWILGVTSLGPTVNLWWAFRETATFPKWLYHFNAFTPEMYEKFLILPVFANICAIVFFIIAILVHVKWYFIVVFIRIPLMTHDVGHLFLCLLALYLLRWNGSSSLLPIFKMGCLPPFIEL